ncbi:putative NRAMP family protein [Helianthus annuus]|uniref:NRAMP family protein n=10 Tax=Helianthus annuus TaxID=4232 RepID=A0A251UC58_HELAN|nr:ethylene-insensitive protein 2 [Helianthus annuus]KAF5799227.1 putative NRAMP family protein [Helianthus annuus]KAJ0550687.1 putative NRAMP family protein [Helianthus annuus]KAJ0563654.1 putative NRAMP family protein [Helianthus annuus]KAJ0728986.1 putative NRAMP family protein [Helianthus annuus]KAJ0731743.1 putative NRAMP family protein [Helianthus annuus]
METDALTTKPQPNMPNRLLPAVLPVLFIAIAYVDPGKWVAAVEGGARFGYDLIIPMFIFSLAAVLCQYLSACITVVTGRNLAEICSSEYDAVTCIFLGVQAELSMTALDLSMVLGIAHGLNMMFGINLFTCVLLTSLDAFLFPLFSNLLETGKAKFTCVCLASFALLSYLFGVLASQPDTSLSVDGGMTIRLTGENVFAFISLLGASIMPHNFYLHSSIVQQTEGPKLVSKEAVCLDHLYAISGVFSGIFIVNYVLMNSAANVFYSTGLDLLPFQDALSLMDQVFRSLMGPFALILILAVSNHTAALTSKFSGQPVVQNFFKLDIPVWLHHSTIRFIAIIPALMCSWHSGAEGTYQLLIVTQIAIALLLPSSVIPLFRIATSRSVMGVNKGSKVVEFMVLGTFIGMLGLEIMFVIEMVFGNSDWASNIRWNPNPYTMILVTACASFFLMLWLVVTPLKSASFELDSVPESSTEYDRIEEFGENKVASVGSHPESPSFNLPEEILESENGLPLTTIEENSPETQISSPPEDSTTIISGGEGLKKEECKSIERTLSIDGISHVKETEQKIEAYRPEEPIKVVSEMNHVVTPDGPGSFKNLKKEDVGSGTGSWSKLAGLGRAARRQLAAVLDEFWGQLFDFHGELTQEAKTRKLDKLLGIDCKVGPSPSPNLNPNLKPNPNPNPSSMSSAQMQLLDAYARRSNLNVMDSSEKRYHSLRLQSTSSGLRIPQAASGAYNDQPATVHGYQIKSYMSQMDQLASKSPTLGSSNYKGPYSLTKGLQNGTSPAKPPGFPDPVVSRNNSMYPERSYYNHNHPVETMHGTVNEKKYYSMPDISGLSLGPKMNGLSMYSGPSGLSYASGSPLGYVGAHQLSSGSDTWSIWSRNPLEQFGVAEKANNSRLSLNLNTQDTGSTVDLEANLLKSLRLCIVKLLKLEGSDWLFQQDSGLDEDLVDRVAARERFLFEVESKEMNGLAQPGDPGMKIDLVTSIPNCGEGCVWRADLITSFGVWSIHRVLELSLMESRPELWGKYTYVLNRLQGIIELAFSKPRAAMSPCFCLQLPTSYHQRKASPPKSATSLPPPAKQSKGKCTTAASLLDIVKDVEIAISCRKGRTGTAAGDVAFPKGKENLASVLKRYKRRLSNKPAVAPDALNKSSYCGL